jgi:hypothetical protein
MADTKTNPNPNVQRYQNQNISEYRVGTLEYPNGLRVNADLQNYVAFYINTRDKATGGKNTNLNSKDYVSPQEQARLNALNNTGARISQDAIKGAGQVITNNVGFIAAGLTGAIGIGMGVKLSQLPALAVTATSVGLLAEGIKEAVKDYSSFASGSTSRLKDVITLHISEKPVVHYGVNYTNRDLGLLTGLLAQGSAMGSLKNVATNPEIGSRLVADLAKIPSLKAAGGTFSDLLELNTRQKTNPFREVLFESVDYRTFQFSYRFLPKTKDETEKIKQIIATFKKHMHPEISQNKLFYIYPSEFDIKYYYKNQVNDYLHRFARCALTDMTVDYGGDQFVTFKNGAPVEIGMTLKFQELEQMTSEGIKNNGY